MILRTPDVVHQGAWGSVSLLLVPGIMIINSAVIGAVWSATSIAASSPTWLDWSGPWVCFC